MYIFYWCHLQTANISNGLSLLEAESAIKAIAVIHALTLGIKIKEKVDLNEKYPVSCFLVWWWWWWIIVVLTIFGCGHISNITLHIFVLIDFPWIIWVFFCFALFLFWWAVSLSNIKSNGKLSTASRTGTSTINQISRTYEIA